MRLIRPAWWKANFGRKPGTGCPGGGATPGTWKRTMLLTAALLVLCVVNLLAQPEAERQLRVFAPQTTYVVPIVEHDGTPYAGLFEVLEPLGRVESHSDQTKVEAEIHRRFLALD